MQHIKHQIERTNSKDVNFILLTNALDKELAIVDGEDHALYSQYNNLDEIKHASVLYHNNKPVGCGGFKVYDENTIEIKRMFVEEDFRGKGAASKVLSNLEDWARDLGYQFAILETGERLPAAIAMYLNKGYFKTENYGQYVGMANSLCFKKNL